MWGVFCEPKISYVLYRSYVCVVCNIVLLPLSLYTFDAFHVEVSSVDKMLIKWYLKGIVTLLRDFGYNTRVTQRRLRKRKIDAHIKVYLRVEKYVWRQWRVIRMIVKPLRAKLFRWNINIYLHFMSLLNIDMTQVLKILPQVRPRPTYSTKSISWLLMSWRRKEPGHQQP